MASKFQDKYNSFMSRRNGPDQMARDALILAIVLLVLAALTRDGLRSAFTLLGLASMVYSYWRMFSSKVDVRSRENYAYIAKRTEVINKVTAPFKKKGAASGAGSGAKGPSRFQQAAQQAQKAAAQAKAQAQDKEHKYFACPKCGQTVRVPKGAGKIRVKCPKCGEKFEKKA